MGLWRDGAVIGRPGADTRSHAERLPLEAEALARSAKLVHDAIIRCPKPVIAAFVLDLPETHERGHLVGVAPYRFLHLA